MLSLRVILYEKSLLSIAFLKLGKFFNNYCTKTHQHFEVKFSSTELFTMLCKNKTVSDVMRQTCVNR